MQSLTGAVQADAVAALTRKQQQAEAARVRYRTRRNAGKCVRCEAGLQKGDTLYCFECGEVRRREQRKWRRKHSDAIVVKQRAKYRRDLERSRAQKRADRERRKLEGLCLECVDAALDDSLFCEYHRDVNRLQARIRNMRRRKGTVPRALRAELKALRATRPKVDRRKHRTSAAPSTTEIQIDDSMSARVARAMRWFDWASASEICLALDMDAQHTGRNAAQQALGRLVANGEVLRRQAAGSQFHEYRLARAA